MEVRMVKRSRRRTRRRRRESRTLNDGARRSPRPSLCDRLRHLRRMTPRLPDRSPDSVRTRSGTLPTLAIPCTSPFLSLPPSTRCATPARCSARRFGGAFRSAARRAPSTSSPRSTSRSSARFRERSRRARSPITSCSARSSARAGGRRRGRALLDLRPDRRHDELRARPARSSAPRSRSRSTACSRSAPSTTRCATSCSRPSAAGARG